MSRQTRLYFQKTGILLAVYLVLRFLLPLILPFFLAWITVGCLHLLQGRIHLRLMTLGILYLLAFLLLSGTTAFCGCFLLYEPCRSLLPVCQNYWMQCSEYMTWIPQSLSGQLIDAMPSVLTCLFGIFLYLLSVLLFARDWNSFHLMLGKLPFAGPVSSAGKRVVYCVKGWIKAQIRIMIAVSVECAVGYYLLHIPGFLFWAAMTGLIDALPVFGTGTVFFPWILIAVLQDRVPLALWLGLLYLVTWLTRELLEPKLLGDGLGLIPVCFLMSVIAGLELFGALGLFTGPFGVLMIRELWAELDLSDAEENNINL